MGIGRILLSPQHFFPYPQLAPATTKPPTMLPTHTCASPHWSPRVFGALTMCPPPPINLWQYSAPHLHPCNCSEPGCTATFGCACPSMFPIVWRTFHHKPALVAQIILCLEDFLCAHHTNFPNFQLLGTRADPHRPAFLPTCPFTACTQPCTPFHARPGTT